MKNEYGPDDSIMQLAKRDPVVFRESRRIVAEILISSRKKTMESSGIHDERGDRGMADDRLKIWEALFQRALRREE